MDVKQDQSFKRLLKKLSALRATLKNDERKLLDQLVIGSADEVEAHSLTPRPTPRPNPRPSTAADEVKAHSMKNERPKVERVNLRVAFDATKEEYRPIP